VRSLYHYLEVLKDCLFPGFNRSEGPLCYDCPNPVQDPNRCTTVHHCASNEVS